MNRCSFMIAAMTLPFIKTSLPLILKIFIVRFKLQLPKKR